MISRLLGPITLAVGIFVLAATVMWVRPWDGSRDTAPQFALRAATGEISDKALAGQPYGLFFGFTHCPDICPTTLRQLSDALEEAGPAAGDLKLYFVTVDPERDTPEVLADYLASFDRRLVGLSGSRKAIDGMMRQFRVTAVKVPTSSGYVYDHSTAVYLMDRRGRRIGLLNIDRPVAAVAAELVAHAARR